MPCIAAQPADLLRISRLDNDTDRSTTMKSNMCTKGILAAGTALLLTTALGACGSSSDATTATSGSNGAGASTGLNPLTGVPAPAKDATLAGQVPATFKQKGALVVGTDATLAPKEFMGADNKTIQGLDIDLTYAVGDVLGLKMNFTNAAFDTLIPGVQNGRFDLVNSSAAPTPVREKVVDMVTTDYSGEQLLVQKVKADSIKSLDDLCGHPVGVQRGSLEAEDLQTQTTKCTGAGKKAIAISAFPDATSVNLALNSNRVDAVFMDVPVSAYQAKQSNGALTTTGPIVRAGLESMFTKKGNGLAQPLVGAMNKLIEDGTYQKIFAKWGLAQSVLKRSVINPRTEQG
jgi:polar amino acid transport system substrate-binding protein